MRVSPRFKVVIVKDDDTGDQPLISYIVQLAESWSPFADEPHAEGIRDLLVSMENSGPRGQEVRRDDLFVLYEATYAVHRIAHAPDPDNPQVVYALLAYREEDAEQGRAEAWSLLFRSFGLDT
jgi:hypothetical protein